MGRGIVLASVTDVGSMCVRVSFIINSMCYNVLVHAYVHVDMLF